MERSIDRIGSENGGTTICPECVRQFKRRQAAAMVSGIKRTESRASVEAVEAINAGNLPRNNSSAIRGIYWYSSQEHYDATHAKRYGLKLNRTTDVYIIEQLSRQPSVQSYIKRLIREDIQRQK